MTKRSNPPSFKGHRFPPEVIEYTVWLYFRFSLSLRGVEDFLAERSIIVSHDRSSFGWPIRSTVCQINSTRPTRKWHLDEVVIPICGKKHWLWRAVDHQGNTLDILVQSRRNTEAAKRFMRKLMKQFGVPRVMITDKLRSHGAAKPALAPSLKHRGHKGLNNPAATD